MLKPLIPDKFCKEFAELNIPQLPLIMATIKGIKPLTDIWVGKNRYDAFKNACKKYNLFYEPDMIFQEPTPNQLKTAGDSYLLTTTKCLGFPFAPDSDFGAVHVFISKDHKQIREAHKFGTYPVIVRNRVLLKPYMDHARFGEVLGYPECCIRFFMHKNDRGLSTPFETLNNTTGKPIYYCNNILNSNSYSYIHHHPCSFNCKETIKIAKAVESEIEKEEPEYVEKIRHVAKLPLIVFNERDAYIFDGSLTGNEITYSSVEFVGITENNRYEDEFRDRDKVVVNDKSIQIFKNNNLLKTIGKKEPKDGFLLRFYENF